MASNFKKTLAATLLAVSVGFAQAAPQWCATKVSSLWIDQSGNTYVMMAVLGNYVQVCNLNAAWKGVSPVTCMAWYSSLRSAVSRNSDMIIQYADAPACTALPIYGNAPAPFYIMMNN